jgi:hypothetical protein
MFVLFIYLFKAVIVDVFLEINTDPGISESRCFFTLCSVARICYVIYVKLLQVSACHSRS